MNILEEFWYGNIEPAEYDTSSSKEYKELLQLISRNEEKLSWKTYAFIAVVIVGILLLAVAEEL